MLLLLRLPYKLLSRWCSIKENEKEMSGGDGSKKKRFFFIFGESATLRKVPLCVHNTLQLIR